MKDAANRVVGLFAFPDPGFNIFALRALEGEQLAAGALGLYSKQIHSSPALGADQSLD